MKIILTLFIKCVPENDNYIYATMRREYETNLVPVKGMELEDSAWDRVREIQNVRIFPEDNCYLVWAGDAEYDSPERCEEKIKMYELHNWYKL